MVLAIFGAGGLGREVLETVNSLQRAWQRWESVFFVVDTPEGDPGRTVRGVPVREFAEFTAAFPPEECEFVIALGEPVYREKLFREVKERGYPLATIVHPGASVAASAKLGEGVVVQEFAGVGPDTSLADNAFIQPFAVVGHDSTVGRSSVCSTYAGVMGNCHIGDRTYLGVHVAVREKTNVGSDSIIGMGSMVQRDIPDNVIAMGNPARPMKHKDDSRVFG